MGSGRVVGLLRRLYRLFPGNWGLAAVVIGELVIVLSFGVALSILFRR